MIPSIQVKAPPLRGAFLFCLNRNQYHSHNLTYDASRWLESRAGLELPVLRITMKNIAGDF
jgi:hypothetical protein